MMLTTRAAGLALAFAMMGSAVAFGQPTLRDVLARHGVVVPDGSVQRAFDDNMTPTSPVTPGSLATPLAMMVSATGDDRAAAAYAFGVLAGRAGRAAAPQELAAAGQALVQMIDAADQRTRVAGARVAGRVFAVPFDARVAVPLPPGLIDALFALLNREADVDQLVAMEALGLTRTVSAVSSLNDRYFFYRNNGQRALAGGALEALARIGDASTIELVRVLVVDKWAAGRDATALAVDFARERMLRDGSVVRIRQALNEKSRRAQALSYLVELGVSAP